MLLRILAAVLLTALVVACGDAPTAPAADAPASDGQAGDPAATEQAEDPAAGKAGDGEQSSGEGIELDSSFDEVFAEIEGLEGQARRDALLAMAAEEGDVNWYTSLNAEVVSEVVDAYEEATGLGISVYRASGETILSRAIEEAAAGFAGADIVENNGTELTTLSGEGVLQPFTSPVHDGLVEGAAREAWTATRFNIFTIAWNTDAVAEGEQPQSYQDLADPKWDGRMAMELKDYDWYWAVWNYLVDEGGTTEEEVDAFFQEVADGAAFVSGHSVMRQLLVAGEYAMTTSDYSYGVAEQIVAGAPVAWQPAVEPLFGRPNGMGLVRNAPNPAAAVAFLEWMLVEGQEVLADNNIDPARADLLDLGGAEVRILDIEAYLAAEDEFITKYEELARAGEVVEG